MKNDRGCIELALDAIDTPEEMLNKKEQENSSLVGQIKKEIKLPLDKNR